MATQFQDFNRGGSTTLNILFLVILLVAVVFFLERRLQGNPRALKDAYVLAIIATVFMWLVSVFLNFSPVSRGSIFLGFYAVIGYFAFRSMHPYFLVLYTAIVLYNLVQFPQVYDLVQNTDCMSQFGNDDFCGYKWQTFLTFMFVMYELLAMGTAFASFVAFMDLYSGNAPIGGSPQTSVPANVAAPAQSQATYPPQPQFGVPNTQQTYKYGESQAMPPQSFQKADTGAPLHYGQV